MKRLKNLSFSALFFSIIGCAASAQITKTPRSSLEQELLVRALERAMVNLDTKHLTEKTVAVDFYGLTPDKDFAKEYFTAWLEAQRVRVAAEPRLAQLHLKVFASVLAVDQGQSFLGAPSFTVPVIGFAMPEIALFRSIEHSGHAEIKMSVTDAQSGAFIQESAPAIGHSRHEDYTLLVVIHFTRTDLQEPRWNWGSY